MLRRRPRERPRIPPFAVERFRAVEATSRRALLRLEGRWSVPAVERPSEPRLVVLYGSRRLRLAPLPGSTDVRSGDRWRAGFAVPHDVLAARSAFLLDAARSGMVRLPAPIRDERRTGRPSARRSRILIAGHSEFERALLRRFFERAGCSVAEVDTGEAAVLEMACSECVDAVLASDRLADGPVLALVRWIRGGHSHQCRDVPVLVLSSDDSDEFKIRAYDAGADMVAAKPIALGVLDRKLRAISHRAAQHAEAQAVRDR